MKYILQIGIRLRDPTIMIHIDKLFIVVIIAFILFGKKIKNIIRNHMFNNYKLIPVELDLGANNKVKYKILRNEENMYITNRIYIELITRKAALEIEPEHDVIVEVYNSWYKLFNIIRDEIKSIPGSYLNDNKTNELIELTIKLLNEGLRPHLTKYQADFRTWYYKEVNKEENSGLKPQEIQKKYRYYNELIEDMKKVNKILFDYSQQLKKIISS